MSTKSAFGKVVTYHVTTEELALNNNQPKCPAIVTQDLKPGSENKNKIVNLKILYDSQSFGHATNAGFGKDPGQWE